MPPAGELSEAPAPTSVGLLGVAVVGGRPGVDIGASEEDDVSDYLHSGRGCTTRARLRKLFDTKTKF
jgi:hypothetical protein